MCRSCAYDHNKKEAAETGVSMNENIVLVVEKKLRQEIN